MKKRRTSRKKKEKILHVTRVLFVTTQIAALVWVSISYIIAIYTSVKLGMPYPVVELSSQAISTILGVNVLKVVENIFEHNNSPVFGNSDYMGYNMPDTNNGNENGNEEDMT